MGEPMALNLLAGGHPVIAWSRSQLKYPIISAAGGETVPTVKEVFKRCRVVIMMLANASAIDEVLARDTEQFQKLVGGHVVVHMGTTSPAYSEELQAHIQAVGGEYVEAPVSGSRKPAESGDLIGMLAGAPGSVDEVRPLLTPMLLKSVDCGTVPSALRMKLAVNLFLITQVVGLAESFNFARRHNLDMAAFRDALDSGPMASAVSRTKLAKLMEGDFTVQASLSDVHYNSRLISDAVATRGLCSPLMHSATHLLAAAEEMGLGHQDMAAVVGALQSSPQQPT